MKRLSVTASVALAAAALAAGPAACSGSTSNGNPNVVGGGMAGAAGKGGQTTAGSLNNGGNTTSTSGAGGANAAGDSAAAGAAAGGAPLAGAGGEAGAAGSPELPAGGASGACEAVVAQQALAPGIHVATCIAINYATNPPSSGEHYPYWADFGVYDFPLPRGFWVHNLEHGAVVVTYNCAAGCADQIAAATAWLAQLTPDATCSSGPPRVLLVPDPLLDVPWAASSWGFTLRADCFDAAAFTDFYQKHVGQPLAPEATLCGTGVDFRAEGVDTCGAK